MRSLLDGGGVLSPKSRVAAARTEASTSEEATIKAIEAALLARQQADAQAKDVEKAAAEVAAASQKADRCVKQAERARDAHAASLTALEEARAATLAATAAREHAAQVVIGGPKAAEHAAIVTALARDEERAAGTVAMAADKRNVAAAQAAAVAVQSLKVAKMTAEEKQQRAEELREAASALEAMIATAKRTHEEKSEAAAEAAKAAHEARTDAEEKAQALETAARAAEDVEGEGSAWATKTQERLKQREADNKRAVATAAKAARAETAAEAAELEAETRVNDARESHATKLAEAEAAEKEASDAHDAAARCTEEQLRLAEAAAGAEANSVAKRAIVDEMMRRVAEAEKEEEDTAPGKAEARAAVATETEANARIAEAEADATVIAASAAEISANAESEAATKSLAVKRVTAEKMGEKGRYAEAKETVAMELVSQLKEKVLELAIAKLESRGLKMERATAMEAADGAQYARLQRAAASRPGAKQAVELSVIDKWQRWCDRRGDEVWNARRLLFKGDGKIVSSLDMLVSDIIGSALDLGPISPKHCTVSGDGLATAALGAPCSFTIVAHNAVGTRFEDGGAQFVVKVRFAGQGANVRAKVVDNGDGSYQCSYKPTCSGRCTISVSIAGQEVGGSPFVCMVSTAAPSAPQCEARSETLSSLAAGSVSVFSITFRDALGQLAHATELDVWVEPKGNEISAQGGRGVQQDLLRPLGACEALVVGPSGLVISRAVEPDSEVIGILPPGRTLRLKKTPQISEDGAVRACIALPVDDRHGQGGITWRDLWPSQQNWRTPSWRAHIDEFREGEEAKLLALERQMQQMRNRAAIRLQNLVRGKSSRRAVARIAMQLIEEKRAAAAAEVTSKSGKKKKKGGNKDGKGVASPPKAPKPAAAPTPAKSSPAAAKPGSPAKTPNSGSPTKGGKAPAADKKGSSKKKSKEALAAEEAEAAAQAEAAEAEAAEAKAAKEAQIKAAAELTRLKEVEQVRAAIARSQERRREREMTAQREEQIAAAEAAGQLPSSQKNLYKLQHLDHGWATLAHKDVAFVLRETRRLPAHVRQQHLLQWQNRFVVVNSEREREALKLRDSVAIVETPETAQALGSPRRFKMVPVAQQKRGGTSEANETGFAYGGVVPGRLQAKGQPLESHEVRFSVAKIGDYLMHVTLHGQPNGHVRGSPFAVRVVPGRAHPLFTEIPPSQLPLHSEMNAADSRGNSDRVSFGVEQSFCKLKLPTCDKVGNLCTSGGADVTCGFVGEEARIGYETKQQATTTDEGNGSYILKWMSSISGTFNVYVKIDGLHVVGSPTSLIFDVPHSSARRRTGIFKQATMNSMTGSPAEAPSFVSRHGGTAPSVVSSS